MTIDYNPHALYYSNITAIQEQPTATTITYRAVGDHYLTMSIALTILSVLCGMYSLICTLPALIFSMKVCCFMIHYVSHTYTCYYLVIFFFFIVPRCLQKR